MAKILHVEDQEKIHHLVARVLADDQINISWASSLEKADDYMSNDSFDLVILDLNLEDGDGSEYCEKVKTQYPQQPIFILSGDLNISTKVMNFVTGAEDYITKPFNNDELRAKVISKLKSLGCYGDS